MPSGFQKSSHCISVDLASGPDRCVEMTFETDTMKIIGCDPVSTTDHPANFISDMPAKLQEVKCSYRIKPRHLQSFVSGPFNIVGQGYHPAIERKFLNL